MEKRNYVKPLLNSEAFVPSEYIAACWGVGCNIEQSNQYEIDNGWYYMDVSHATAHCGSASNQVIYDDNNDGIADRMVEEGTDGLGNLTCTIYSDSGFSNKISVSSVKPGQNIYWTTAAGNKVWHHHGIVYATFPGRPLHS